MANHIEKLLREPLLWACGFVLCLPLLGSGTLLSLRNALTFDSGNAEVVELDHDLVSYTGRTTEMDTSATKVDSSFNSDFSAAQQPRSLPPLPSTSTESPPDSSSGSILDESMPVSLPGRALPELVSNDPKPPVRDPGSLLDFGQSNGYDSTDESQDSGEDADSATAEASAAKKQDQDFDFLFGDDDQEKPAPEPGPKPSYGGELPAPTTSSVAEQKPDGLIQPPNEEENTNQFFPDTAGAETGPSQDSAISGQLDFAQPMGIEQVPFGQALPTQQHSVEIFQPGPAAEPSIYSGEVVTPTHVVAPAHVAVQPQAAWAAPVHVTPDYAIGSGPIYQNVAPVSNVQEQVSRNWTVGLTGMFFQRDYEDNVRLAYNAAGDNLYTNDANERTFDGYGIELASRTSGGRGFEASYWSLNPGRASTSIAGQITTTITGLDQLIHTPSGNNLYEIYSYSVAQHIVRDTDINNLELNLLREGGSYCRWNRQGYRELFGGFRWFEFSESLQYATFTDTGTYPSLPSEFYYNLHARNRLLGLQAGVRNELTFGPKLRLFSSVKGGIFNNNIRTAQNITDLYGDLVQVNAGPGTGRPFSYNDEKNDVAYLGELNFGVHWYLTCNARLRLGYRVLGVSGVALAANQLPFRYDDPEELLRAKSNGNLLLNGGFYGIEFSF